MMKMNQRTQNHENDYESSGGRNRVNSTALASSSHGIGMKQRNELVWYWYEAGFIL